MGQDPKQGRTIGQPAAESNAELAPETPGIRFLRRMVTVLTGVMIFGMISIVVLFYIRFNAPPAPSLPGLPDTIALPDGAAPQAVTTAPGWIAVVTQDGRILFFDAKNGALLDEVTPNL